MSRDKPVYVRCVVHCRDDSIIISNRGLRDIVHIVNILIELGYCQMCMGMDLIKSVIDLLLILSCYVGILVCFTNLLLSYVDEKHSFHCFCGLVFLLSPRIFDMKKKNVNML